jgi:tRNA (mo5U34)-methyltransferase
VEIKRIDCLSDADLESLNDLLPWAAFVEDLRGRRFGRPSKRDRSQIIPDQRIVRLDRMLGLSGKRVLEVGCFEGLHTVGLAQLGALVTAVDARLENVVKTVVRCWGFDVRADVQLWDVEEPPPGSPPACEILFHVGVLYHLVDPVRHLSYIAPLASEGILLDTHYARPSEADAEYSCEGRAYRYRRQTEGARSSPFAGTGDHAKWLLEDDIAHLMSDAGFRSVEVIERREERNGPRLLLIARR